MKKHFDFRVRGVCSQTVSFDLSEEGIVSNVSFVGGCRGNLSGIARLCEGMPAREVIDRLKGTDCHGGVSCPDQFSKALTKALEELN